MNVLLSVAFVLCWSSGFIGARLGAGTAAALTTLTWRFVPLAVVLLAAATVRSAWRGLTPRDVARQAAIGLLSQSGYLLTVYSAIGLGVSSGTTALIDGVQPLVVGALAGPLLRQRVPLRQWAGLGLGLAGVAVVVTADAGASPAVAWWAFAVPFGGMLSLVAATFLTARTAGAAPVPPLASMAVHATTSAVVFAALAAAAGTARPPASDSFWTAVAWLIALSTFGGYGLYWHILKRSGVTRVNALMFLMAPVTAIWGALMFGEPFSVRTAAGLALSLAAVRLGGPARAPGAALAGADRGGLSPAKRAWPPPRRRR
ncbi:MAG: DMT family transporter [Streptosporangiales bacterium]|nr:DMT family transporter [Streptosporangiales bacterium]